MRSSQYVVSLRTYALAFAVALSPAFLQTITCASGDTALLTLRFKVDGQDQIVDFTSGNRSYDVTTTSDSADLEATSRDPGATVSYRWYADLTLLESGSVGVGGGTVEGLAIPPGNTVLRVYVRAPEGRSADYAVNVTGRPFPCTEQGILDAIARGGGPHTFDCAGPTTVVMTDTTVVDNDVILDGGGLLALEGRCSCSLGGLKSTEGCRGWEGFHVRAATNVELMGMSLSGNCGPIWNAGTLVLTDCAVASNGQPFTFGNLNAPGIFTGDDPSVQATLTLANTTVSGGNGEGIFNTGALNVINSTVFDNLGPGIVSSTPNFPFSASTVTLINSTVSGNTGDGIATGRATVTLTNSTVSGNTSDGIAAGRATVTLTNSTVSGNGDGGVVVLDTGGQLTATNSTVSGNGAAEIVSIAPTSVSNSIIDGECAGGPMTSLGYNIESPGDTCGFDQVGDQVDVTAFDLKLQPLQDNGGPTETHRVGRVCCGDSVAVDQIPQADCALTTDQRGVTRPQGSACDVGAFEFEQ